MSSVGDWKWRAEFDALREGLQQQRERVGRRQRSALRRLPNKPDRDRGFVARLGPAFGAEHMHAPIGGRGAHGRKLPGGAAFELHQHGGGVARIGRRLVREQPGVDLARSGRPRLTSASIRCRPAPVRPPPGDFARIVAPAAGHARRMLVAEMRLDMQHLAERPVRHEALQFEHRRQSSACCCRAPNTTPALRHAATARSASRARQRQRLLAPHMLAGRRDRDDLLDMERMRRCQKHGLHARIGDRFGEVGRELEADASRRNRAPAPAPC